MADNPHILTVQKTTLQQSKTNNVYIPSNIKHNSTDFAFLDATYLYAIAVDPDLPSNTIKLSKVQREYLNKAVEKGTVELDFIDRKYISELSVLQLSIEILGVDPVELDGPVLKQRISEAYSGYPFNKGQRLYLDAEMIGCKSILILTVTELLTDDHAYYGILTTTTNISLASASSKLLLSNNCTGIRSNLSFEQLGIGGLKREFEIMFRRAFVQRMFEPEVIKSLGISHVKGIMLYGPPGTGKTLIARQLGSLLNARPPKIVNGPEILNKYVGQSEENIRNLFKEAEEEFRAKRESSQLHIIIFDEIDAICRRRGSNGNAGVGDQVVNQLLSKMDGVEALENILVIGMTNRLDMIDEALLRPGRFEIHLEISLPDEESRHEIFMIHTRSMSGNNYLEEDVDLRNLAYLSKNYTGAEIASVVRGAISFALERQAKLGDEDERKNEPPSADEIKVGMADMLAAIEEIKPAFGVNEKEFEVFSKAFYDTAITKKAFDLGESLLKKLRETTLYKTNSMLLYGETGTGKTTLAVRMALKSGFPFVKIISPRQLVGLAEYEKVNFIKDCFMNAYKSEEACIILDDIEGLMEFVNIGPRFSNPILQAIKIFVKAEDKKKLFVFGTTAMPEVMRECSLFETFSEAIEVGLCTREDYGLLCTQKSEFEAVEFTEPVSIKRLITMLPEPQNFIS